MVGLRVALVLLAVAGLPIAGCDDDDSDDAGSTPPNSPFAQDVEESVNRLQCAAAQVMGDLNCDGTVEADDDRDGIPNPFDRFPGGPDYGDQDQDGWANWADISPGEPAPAVSDLIRSAPSPDALAQAAQDALIAEAQKLANQNASLQVVLEAAEREQAAWESRNSDTDIWPDIVDPQPTLDAGGDYDDDGSYNWEDPLPLNDGFD